MQDGKKQALHCLPAGWLAPRREFFLSGFGDTKHAFAFDAKLIGVKVSNYYGIGYSDRAQLMAVCAKCGHAGETDDESMREHARLHLAVDLAKVG